MMDFEDQIRNALARKQPPDGFALRVRSRMKRRSPWNSWAAGLVAASLLFGAFGIWREHERGQAAKAKLLQALQITSSKLQRIHKKVESTYQ